MDDGRPETTIKIVLEPSGEGGTVVRVSETGFDALPDGEALAAEHRTGWRMHLEDLRRDVEPTVW